MSKIHFIGGEKGGVGKSLVARLLAQYFIDHSKPFAGYDADQSHGALMRFYAGYARTIALDQIDLDSIVETAVGQPDARALVDLPAQSQSALTRWIDDSSLIDVAKELELTLTYWHVMDAGRDSTDLLRQILDRYGDRIQLVVVLNAIRGARFDIFDQSGQRDRAMAAGASVVSIEHLADTTMQKIDAFDTSFWAAVQAPHGDGKGLGVLERQRVRAWMNRVYTQFAVLDL
jgi:hypothetical protein